VVIGAGIFTITASTAGNITGPAISISFVFAAVACGLAALCYAEFRLDGASGRQAPKPRWHASTVFYKAHPYV
jgi:hypothetical protein